LICCFSTDDSDAVVLSHCAALLESLVQSHPFVDGNKRVAFAVADVFLRINGYAVTADSKAIYDDMMELFEARTKGSLPLRSPEIPALVAGLVATNNLRSAPHAPPFCSFPQEATTAQIGSTARRHASSHGAGQYGIFLTRK
jgi:hypothetical protein